MKKKQEIKRVDAPLLLDLFLGLLLMYRVLTNGSMSLFVHLFNLQEPQSHNETGEGKAQDL